MVAPFRLDSLEQPDPAPIGRHRHGAPSRSRRWGHGRLAAVLAFVVVLVAATFVMVRLRAPAPVAAVTSTLRPTFAVASSPVALPWPTTGQSAIAVPSIGIDVTSGPEQPVPVASLTKLMTAYVVLHDHPLGSGQDGPSITMGQADVDDFDGDATHDQANAQVTVGEVLTERQMMGGLLVHSADNYASTLARWDAGSVPAFVAEMNRAAAQLGMDHTHFADPSGFDPASQSTAGDLLKVAAPDMDNPTFASIVQMASITLPVAGTISTYTPLLGVQGVIGVKSGFTVAAGGCDVLAVLRRVHGLPVLILSAVTGQISPNVLPSAGLRALNLANAVGTSIGSTSIIRSGTIVAHVTVAGRTVDAAVESSGTVLSWPGVETTRILVSTRWVTAGAKRGTRIGTVVVALGTQRLMIPVRLRQDIPKETLRQRIL